MSDDDQMKVKNSINEMENDLETIKNFIAGEIIKLANNNNGQIPGIENKDFQIAKKSLVDSDPDAPENQGKAVLSLKATERGIITKIEKFQKKGADPRQFDDILAKLNKTKTDLVDKLSNDKSVKVLVGEKIDERFAN